MCHLFALAFCVSLIPHLELRVFLGMLFADALCSLSRLCCLFSLPDSLDCFTKVHTLKYSSVCSGFEWLFKSFVFLSFHWPIPWQIATQFFGGMSHFWFSSLERCPLGWKVVASLGSSPYLHILWGLEFKFWSTMSGNVFSGKGFRVSVSWCISA